MFAAMKGGSAGPRKRSLLRRVFSVGRRRKPVAKLEAATRRREERLLAANEGLVVTIARRYQASHPNAEMADLLQQGRLGLLKAARSYRPEYKVPFGTWAGNQAMSEIQQFAHKSHMITPSQREVRRHFKAPGGGRQAMLLTISGHERAGRGEDEATILERIPGTVGGGTDQVDARLTLRSIHRRARMTPLQERVLRLRHVDGLTLKQAAQSVGRTVSRTYKLEISALKRARAAAGER